MYFFVFKLQGWIRASPHEIEECQTMFKTRSRTAAVSVISIAAPISGRERVTYVSVSFLIDHRFAQLYANRMRPRFLSWKKIGENLPK